MILVSLLVSSLFHELGGYRSLLSLTISIDEATGTAGVFEDLIIAEESFQLYLRI